MELDMSNTDNLEVWKGLTKITGYKPKSKLPDELNRLYSRFNTAPHTDRPVCNGSLEPALSVS